MLSRTQIDYNSYWRAFKGNYAKGIRALANILQTPQQANDLTNNLGGVSVLLGTPVGSEDVNSETLRTMLLESAYADNAVNTWLGGFYTFDDLGTLFADQTVRDEVRTSPLLWRAVSMGSAAMAKYVSNLVGLNPDDYADMSAIAASSTVMQAVIDSPTVLDTIVNSTAAMQAIAASSTAMQAVAASSTAMQAIAASYVAEAAIWANSSTLAIVKSNSNAWSIFTGASSSVIGKTAAVLVGLNPDDYADMSAIAASSTVMQAVAASSAARAAIESSSSAMSALDSSPLRTAVSAAATNTNAPRIVYSGNMWLISTTNTANFALFSYYTIDEPSRGLSLNYSSSGESTTVRRFASKIEVTNYTSGEPASCAAAIIMC